MKASKKRGFTIVELIIVIAVIAILAAVLIPTFSNLISRANESVDIQAARNMNTFLATAKYTSGVSSILDVYDVFEESGFKVENYSPLYKGRHYYYDIGYNKILYVDDNGTVLYPEEHKGEQKGARNWCSLSMETMAEKQPDGYTTEGGVVTATVNTAEQLAYVVTNFNNNQSNKSLTLTIDGEIDMMGASCTLREIKGGSVTIKGEGSNAVIKNVTSNKIFTEGAYNLGQVVTKYNGAALFSKVSGGTVKIENVTFENLNVKAADGGSVGLLIGYVNGSGTSVTLKNVTIKNSTVIGHRDVGALVGQMNGTLNIEGKVELDNVAVKTIGGRSAMLCRVDPNAKIIGATNIKINGNCTHEIYKYKSAEQKFFNTEAELNGLTIANNSKYMIEGQEKIIYSLYGQKDNQKQYSAYGFNSKALVICGNGYNNSWSVCTTLDQVNTKLGQH